MKKEYFNCNKKEETEIRRLVLAKKLYLHGCSHASNKDEVSRMLAIHNFDNAVEIVLKCIVTKHQVKPSRKYFYFEELLEKLKELPLKTQMRELHNIRNLVQHQGNIPSGETVIKYKGYTEDFFRDVVKKEFDISYDKLYLSDLIESKKLKKKVLEAEKAFEKKEYKRCIELCDDALIVATFDVGDIFFKAGLLIGYWGAGDELKNLLNKEYIQKKYKETNYYELTKEFSKAILQLGQAATGMQFLEEYKINFLKHREIVENLPNIQKHELKSYAQSSLDFVTNIILRWQEEGIVEKERTNMTSR